MGSWWIKPSKYMLTILCSWLPRLGWVGALDVLLRLGTWSYLTVLLLQQLT